DAWLDPADADASGLLERIETPPTELFQIHAVSTAVNNSRSSGSQLMDEVESMTEQSLTALADQAVTAAAQERLP
ncbi:SOS response-associated peptidase, partial [Acidimicrobiales bacterium]|nr:SOS response-associated peptidase [Acidimicrobiales bacterium]